MRVQLSTEKSRSEIIATYSTRQCAGLESLKQRPDSMDDDLASILSDNPWSEIAEKIKAAMSNNSLGQERFVLNQDDALIRLEESLIRDDDYKLRLNLPPQPFIGNPKAKIWILQYNPGYSEGIDDFDYLGIERADIMPHRQTHVSEVQDRIKLICDQYEFKESAGFYVLDEKFETFKSGTREGRGTYLWYKSTYFPINGIFARVVNSGLTIKRFADNNLFVLEFLPYHSKKFRHEFFPFLPSFVFWRKLMEYAFANEKIVLCNGLNDAQALKACILQSIPGYQKAKSEGWLYKIVHSGRGRSRLMLKADLVCPLEDGTSRLSAYLESLTPNT